MDSSPDRPGIDSRSSGERRSGTDTRTQSEKLSRGERRSGLDRRIETKVPQAAAKPSDEQLALFAKRVRRAVGNERSRDFFGIANSEYEFSIHADVVRTLEWIESLAGGDSQAAQAARPERMSLRKNMQSAGALAQRAADRENDSDKR